MEARTLRIVVTGASGFIGRRLAAAARYRSFDVVALVREGGYPVSPIPGVTVLDWEIGMPLPVDGDVICHLASYIPPDFSDPAHAEKCFHTNTLGTLRLAEAAKERGFTRFVFVSSGQIYAAEQGLADEDAAIRPTEHAGYYLTSKLAAEFCLQYFCRTHDLPLTIIRPSSVYGPGMRGAGIIPTLVERLSKGLPVSVTHGGAHRADFVHVDDVVSAVLAAIERQAGGVFNAGSGEGRTVLELATILADALHQDPGLIRIEGVPSPGGFAALDISKARRVLGYDPIDLQAGIHQWVVERER